VNAVPGPLDLVLRVAELFDGLGIDYVLGGSMASSFFGEPRATMDVDIAIRADPILGEAFIEQAEPTWVEPYSEAPNESASRGTASLH
jgi:hypothetical protein